MLVTIVFSYAHNVFYSIKYKTSHFASFKFSCASALNLDRLTISLVGHKVNNLPPSFNDRPQTALGKKKRGEKGGGGGLHEYS